MWWVFMELVESFWTPLIVCFLSPHSEVFSVTLRASFAEPACITSSLQASGRRRSQYPSRIILYLGMSVLYWNR